MIFDRELIEAALALEMIPADGMPEMAQHALDAGLDGHAIRRLAALNQPTHFEIVPLLSKAKAEMGLCELSKAAAALRIGKSLASGILAQRTADNPLPLCCAEQFEWLWIKAGCPEELRSVGNLPDEIELAKMRGQTIAEIREWITERLRALGA
ncbi:MAG: hypothetical protein ABSF66_14715 [Terriglobales bacterium]